MSTLLSRRFALLSFTLLIFFFYSSIFAQPATVQWADSCINSSFLATIDIDKQYSFSEFDNVYEYLDGDLVVTGKVGPNLPEVHTMHVYGIVMRLSKSGKIKWAKYVGYNDPQYENWNEINASVITRNHDIVIVSQNDIIRLDPSGNAIWKYQLQKPGFNVVYEQVIETQDKGFLLTGPGFSNGVVTKLNSHGTAQWQRVFSLDAYLDFRNVTESPSGYYVSGYSSNASTYQQNVLVKLNKATGDILWAKGFGKPYAEFAFESMDFRNGLLELTGNSNQNYFIGKSVQAFLTFTEEGQVVQGKRIENPDIPVVRSSLFRNRLFDVATKTGLQYSLENEGDLYVYRLNEQWLPLWGWRFPFGGREWALDMQVLQDSSLAVCGQTSIVSFNPVQRALLVKTTKMGKLSNCNNYPFKPIVSDYSLSVSPLIVNNSPLPINKAEVAKTPVFEATGFEWKLNCTAESTSRLSKIDGRKILCTGSPTLYKVTRDGTFSSKVTFFTSSSIAAIENVSDTSINITFHKEGRAVLYAAMPVECGELKDSIVIESINSPGPVDIGPSDSILCMNNTILLNAHYGYLSYEWQDGSRDSTFLVNQPGTYHIMVQDACGNLFTDTILIKASSPITFNVGPNRFKCNNDTIHLKAPNGFLNYEWSPSYSINASRFSQDVVVNPQIDTAYFIKAEKQPGCFVFDSIHVAVLHSPAINLGADLRFCEGDSIELNAGKDFIDYRWSNGDTGPTAIFKETGRYYINGKYSNGCISTDTIEVLPLYKQPNVNIQEGSGLCKGGRKELAPGTNFTNYLWQDGSTGTTLVIRDLGTYWVEATDSHGCKGSDTVRITTFLPLPGDFLPHNQEICSYETLTIKPLKNFKSYNWSTGSTSSSIHIDKSGNYFLEVKDFNGCIGTDTITVNLKECKEGFYIANAFTPNGDGKNDQFRPLLFGNILSYHFTIYNRWGEKVFESTEVGNGWDGRVKAVDSDSHVYVWACQYQLEGETLKQEKGTVVLIR